MPPVHHAWTGVRQKHPYILVAESPANQFILQDIDDLTNVAYRGLLDRWYFHEQVERFLQQQGSAKK